MIEETIASPSQTSELLLDSLEITNFRAFPHLRIEQLGRVNLIVGRNSVGKTSLLEALWLYAHGGSPLVIKDLLQTRDELVFRSDENFNFVNGLKYLFCGRLSVTKWSAPIKIGSAHDINKELSLTSTRLDPKDQNEGVISQTLPDGQSVAAPDSAVALTIESEFRNLLIPLNRLNAVAEQHRLELETDPSPSANNFIFSSGLTEVEKSRLWSQIALSDLEDEVIKALKIVSVPVERVTILDDPSRPQFRYPIVRLKGMKEPLPLRSLGDGINRIFGIVLALVNSKDGLLLVDEIENGLYHGVQYELWKLILEVASRLNVQVFATTHSWDCIEAFQAATHENQQESGMLVRLENKDGQIVPVTYDERRLAIATRAQIEVR